MTTTTYPASATPKLVITCHNDLTVTGSNEANIIVEIDDDSPANHVEQRDEALLIYAVDSCDVVCPAGASIAIEQVSGDLRVTQIKGTLAIQTVNGDAAVRESIEAAVYRASPLPQPPDPDLFDRNLVVTFAPND